jgi:hypothetical protein
MLRCCRRGPKLDAAKSWMPRRSWMLRCGGVAVWRWSVRVPFLSAFSRQLRGCWGSTADSKADGGDGRGDLRGESFERPVFAGVQRSKLARERSCRTALSGRIWRSFEVGAAGERCAAGWRGRTTAGGWGAERAHLAKAGGRGAKLVAGGGRSWGLRGTKLAQIVKL